MSAYFAEKMINKYITKYSSNQRLFFSFNVCMQIKLVNILTYVPIFSYKSDVTNRHVATDGTHRGSNKISRGNSIDS